MTIREPIESDKPQIDRIYNSFFSHNEYPDFLNKDEFKCSFVIVDDNNIDIILAGGVKLIAETVVVTDQNYSKRIRFDALLQALGSSIYITQAMKNRQMHVFVNGDEKYVQTLQRFGFKLMDAKLLILDFGEHNGKAKSTSDTNS